MKYPSVLSEENTIRAALMGRSLARYGDGELRLALGGQAISQERGKGIRRELCAILAGPSASLPCIPNAKSSTPKFKKTWYKYIDQKFLDLYKQKEYGSSFITRPDSAPWIDTPAYWSMVQSLWAGKDVTMVVGTQQTSLTGVHLKTARHVTVVVGPQTNAYKAIDGIEEQIGKPSGPVIMCLGATATVLAERLARKGVQAIDLGHMGRYIPKEWKR